MMPARSEIKYKNTCAEIKNKIHLKNERTNQPEQKVCEFLESMCFVSDARRYTYGVRQAERTRT